MNIRVLKLVTGEEVLSEITNSDSNFYYIKNPVGIAVVRGQNGPNIGFTPFPLHAEPKSGSEYTILKDHVVLEYEAAEEYTAQYDNLFGSGIVLPKKQIITG